MQTPTVCCREKKQKKKKFLSVEPSKGEGHRQRGGNRGEVLQENDTSEPTGQPNQGMPNSREGERSQNNGGIVKWMGGNAGSSLLSNILFP